MFKFFAKLWKQYKAYVKKEFLAYGYKDYCGICNNHAVAHMGSVAADPSDYCPWRPMTRKEARALYRRD